MQRHWRWVTTGCLVLFGLIYLPRMDRVVGLFGDDAWYVLLAKSLATGQGYTLINSPSTNITPFYPPGFPFLLSLAWRIYGQFPQNLWLLKSVSVLASYTMEGEIAPSELPERIGRNAWHLLEYDFGALINYPMYRAIEPSEGRLRYWQHDYLSLF
ncbi:MAG: hypothetical protein ACREEM_53485 [Blastocatellia bacterium]